MAEVRFFDTEHMDWTEEARFPGIRFKVLETRQTHPAFSMVRVLVDVDRTIQTHTHAIETETAYVLAGQGVLQHGDAETPLTMGMTVSIPPGIPHSLRNTGDAPLELVAMHSPHTR